MSITINDKTIKLTVGIYTIHMKLDLKHELYYLSEHMDKFIDNNDTCISEHSFSYTICTDDSFVEPNLVPVAEFKEGPVAYKIYQFTNMDYLWIRMNKNGQINLVFQISSDWNSWNLIYDKSSNFGKSSFAEMAYIFPYSILNKRGILFHGVVMEWNSMGIIVCAHSGVGKTTHTRMWRDFENALILNGDRALCCIENDIWYTYGAPWNGSSGECINRKARLNAVVILEQSEINQIIMLSPLHTALELIQLAFAPSWEESLMNSALDYVDSIVRNIPIYKLKCRPDLEAVELLKAELLKIKV